MSNSLGPGQALGFVEPDLAQRLSADDKSRH